MAKSTRTVAKETGIAVLREARSAGWLRARVEWKPDGSVILDAAMSDVLEQDDFDNVDLRMGS